MTRDDITSIWRRESPQCLITEEGLRICEAVAKAERERCKARALEIIGWHRNDYNGRQVDTILAEIKNAL